MNKLGSVKDLHGCKGRWPNIVWNIRRKWRRIVNVYILGMYVEIILYLSIKIKTKITFLQNAIGVGKLLVKIKFLCRTPVL